MDPTDLRAELAERLAHGRPLDAEAFNAACFMLSRSLEELEFSVPEAAPLVRRLLRVAGRVIIDTAAVDSSPEMWPNTREMALEWINEALRALASEGRPAGDSSRRGGAPAGGRV